MKPHPLPLIVLALALAVMAYAREHTGGARVPQNASKEHSDTSAHKQRTAARMALLSGRLFAQEQQLDSAEKHLRQALQLFRANGDSAGMAECEWELGRLALERSDFGAAAERLEASLEFGIGLNDSARAEILRTLARAQSKTGDFSAASASIEEAGALRSSPSDSLLSVARLLFDQGRFTRAFDLCDNALADSSTFNNGRRVRFLTLAGRSQRALGRPDIAQRYFEVAIGSATDSVSETSAVIARAYQESAAAFRQAGAWDAALDADANAYAIMRRLYGPESPRTAHALALVATDESALGAPSEARRKLRRVQAMRSRFRGPQRLLWFEVQIIAAQALAARGAVDSALIAFDAAQRAVLAADSVSADVPARHSAAPQLLAIIFARKAALFERRAARNTEIGESLSAAADMYRRAYEAYTVGEIMPELRLSLLYDPQLPERICNGGIRVELALYAHTGNRMHRDRAFGFIECKKMTALRGALQQADPAVYFGVSRKALAQERKLWERLCKRSAKLRAVKADSGVGTTRRGTVLRALDNAYEAYEAHLADVSVHNPRYYEFRHNTEPVTLRDLQSALDDSTVYMMYDMADSALRIVVIDRSDCKILSTSAGRGVARAGLALRRALQKRNRHAFLDASRWLYRHLIAPIESQLRDKQRLIVAPDATMWGVPMAALSPGDHVKPTLRIDFTKQKYLVKRFNIAYSLAAGQFTLAQAAVKKQRLRSGKRQMIALAPGFDAGTAMGVITPHLKSLFTGELGLPSGLPAALNDTAFAPQPWAVDELERVGRVAASADVEFLGLQGAEATKAPLQSAAIRQYEYVHLAIRILLNDLFPWRSTLVFAQSQVRSAAGKNIALPAELYGMGFEAETICLSGGEWDGGVSAGATCTALIAPLAYSGASNIVIALWNAENLERPNPLVEMYSGMFDGTDAVRALADAQRAFIASKSTAFPLFWGGVMLLRG